ncbi:cell division protein FtsL [Anoxybacillus vitaminiphilus]|uniref:Cell division protein FtsL n=1 Tax=Paranoxybacillus vitaminiphilus TaxID=581036 RepID=A0A327YU55_9BACL|nr:cell division protein FtsL [Anoxybacillus vitaminiphilus]RAK23265.1 cell division protein FtsL [Anoxybacillus vitaminiphilus]
MNHAAVKIKTNEVQRREHHVRPKRKRQFRTTLGEKVLLFAFAMFVVYCSIQIVSNQVAIYQANKQIQQLEETIQEQKKYNNDLSVQVQELSTYERILEKAKELGLSLNENNVKVVQE